jgi:hypothetical protein
MRSSTLLQLEPESLREGRARTAVEALLVVATLVSLGSLATSRGPPPAGPPWASIPIDVARDGPGRLRLLPGLGPTRVAAILYDRQARGQIERVEDLRRIRGLGGKTIDALRAAGAIVARPADPTTDSARGPGAVLSPKFPAGEPAEKVEAAGNLAK